jgi:hypothetical protein
MSRYWAFKNAWSMDGLPGMKKGLEVGKRENVAPIKKMVGPLAPARYQPVASYTLEHLIVVAVLFLLLGYAFARVGPGYVDRLSEVLDMDLKTIIWH